MPLPSLLYGVTVGRLTLPLILMIKGPNVGRQEQTTPMLASMLLQIPGMTFVPAHSVSHFPNRGWQDLAEKITCDILGIYLM